MEGVCSMYGICLYNTQCTSRGACTSRAVHDWRELSELDQKGIHSNLYDQVLQAV